MAGALRRQKAESRTQEADFLPLTVRDEFGRSRPEDGLSSRTHVAPLRKAMGASVKELV